MNGLMAKGWFAASIALLATSIPRHSSAQIYDRAERHRRDTAGSDTDFAVELRFGPYTPRIDSEFSSATPYRDTFGNKLRFLLGLEFDWQALKVPGVGSLGPGIGWGVTGMTAKAPFTAGGGRSSQDTNLWIMPMYVVAVGRLTALTNIGVPVEPYAKAGLGIAPWWTNDSVKTSEVNGVIGHGTSTGYQFALGAVLNLAFIDPEAAEGLGGAGLFGEFYFSSLNGFGSGNQMQVGTTTWFVGITVQM